MKKFFEEPSIECQILCTENITDNDVVQGSLTAGDNIFNQGQ